MGVVTVTKSEPYWLTFWSRWQRGTADELSEARRLMDRRLDLLLLGVLPLLLAGVAVCGVLLAVEEGITPLLVIPVGVLCLGVFIVAKRARARKQRRHRSLHADGRRPL